MNKNLAAAKKTKNDEFYTQLGDIVKELNATSSTGDRSYWGHFKDKVVYCNCDDHRWSQFVEYFKVYATTIFPKKLIATHYHETDAQKLVIEFDEKGNVVSETVTQLEGNGDFRSPECVELLREADIVVTNPPFSLFREFIALLEEHGKQYLVIGSQNAITYKETFKLIKANRLWLGVNLVKEFRQPDGTVKKFGNIGWFTNLPHHKRNEKLFLMMRYGKDMEYPRYDNYDAIEVSKTANIPEDYDGVMGVPISFLTKYNPDQFEIIGLDRYVEGNTLPNRRMFIEGKEVYARILIKHKKAV